MHIIKCTGGAGLEIQSRGEEGGRVTFGTGEGDRSQGFVKVGIISQPISKFTILTTARDKLPHQVWMNRRTLTTLYAPQLMSLHVM